MLATDLDYSLPEELIAQTPLPQRDSARLLVVDRQVGAFSHQSIGVLPSLPKALWVVNDTRVIPARLRGQKSTGGRIELLLVERLSITSGIERWLCLGRGIQVGNRLEFASGLHAKVIDAKGDGQFDVELETSNTDALLREIGEVPLPPYIRRPPNPSDDGRYQTVFAEHPGSVAAPTAGLHFTRELMEKMREHGHEIVFVTLHVGPGTFQPLRSEHLADHRLLAERYNIPAHTSERIRLAKRVGLPVVAVGTTVMRTLESAVDAEGAVQPGHNRTDLFIYPPFNFRAADALLTNFHLPKSTLLALVMAFGGVENVRRAYDAAIAERYRFYSYGDAMLIMDGI